MFTLFESEKGSDMAIGKKRRQYIVDKQQYKVSAVIILYTIIAIFLTGLIVFLPSFIGLSTATDSIHEVSSASEILVLHKRFWPAIIIVAFVLGAHSIFYFHRLFGPLYRFKRVLKEVAKGNLSFNFEIRRKDFFVKEKEAIDDMISSLGKNIGELKKDNDLLVETIHQLDASLEDQATTMDTVRQKVKEMQRTGDKLSKRFNTFKLR